MIIILSKKALTFSSKIHIETDLCDENVNEIPSDVSILMDSTNVKQIKFPEEKTRSIADLNSKLRLEVEEHSLELRCLICQRQATSYSGCCIFHAFCDKAQI